MIYHSKDNAGSQSDDNNVSSSNTKEMDQGKVHYKNGVLLFQEKKYDDAIGEFKKSLVLRESTVGRYDLSTASLYACIGACYFQKGDYDNAIISCRPWLRIRRYVATVQSKSSSTSSSPPSEGSAPVVVMNTPSINKYTRIRDSLKNKGFSDGQIKLYDSNLNISLQHEIDGDIFREQGEYIFSIEEYREAIAIENNCVGNDVTLAFLWRKIKVMVDMCGSGSDDREDEDEKLVDWKKIDIVMPPTKNKKQPNIHGLSESTFEAIQQGDMYHSKCDYRKALQAYRGDIPDSGSITTDDGGDDLLGGGKKDNAVAASTAGKDSGSTLVTNKPVLQLNDAGAARAASDVMLLESFDSKMGEMQSAMMGRLDEIIQAQVEMMGRLVKSRDETRDDVLKHLDDKINDLQRDMKRPLDRMSQTQEEMMDRLGDSTKRKLEQGATTETLKKEVIDLIEVKMEKMQSDMKHYVDMKLNGMDGDVQALMKQMEEKMTQWQVEVMAQVQSKIAAMKSDGKGSSDDGDNGAKDDGVDVDEGGGGDAAAADDDDDSGDNKNPSTSEP